MAVRKVYVYVLIESFFFFFFLIGLEKKILRVLQFRAIVGENNLLV